MKPFRFSETDDGPTIGLSIDPRDGNLLTSIQLKIIKPFIVHAIEIVTNNVSTAIPLLVAAKLIVTEKNSTVKLQMTNLSQAEQNNLKKIMETIAISCHQHLSQKIVVTQLMDSGFNILHKPLHFATNINDGSISVRFTEFGEPNNFDAAIEFLKTLYPGVKTLLKLPLDDQHNLSSSSMNSAPK